MVLRLILLLLLAFSCSSSNLVHKLKQRIAIRAAEKGLMLDNVALSKGGRQGPQERAPSLFKCRHTGCVSKDCKTDQYWCSQSTGPGLDERERPLNGQIEEVPCLWGNLKDISGREYKPACHVPYNSKIVDTEIKVGSMFLDGQGPWDCSSPEFGTSCKDPMDDFRN